MVKELAIRSSQRLTRRQALSRDADETLGTPPLRRSFDALTQISGAIAVSAEQQNRSLAELEQANGQLAQSLEHCRVLLSQCREQIAANSNNPQRPAHGDGSAAR